MALCLRKYVGIGPTALPFSYVGIDQLHMRNRNIAVFHHVSPRDAVRMAQFLSVRQKVNYGFSPGKLN